MIPRVRSRLRPGGLLLVASLLIRLVSADEIVDIRQQREIQEGARILTRALVREVLDVQITQLEENGFQGLKLLRDVRGMRENLSGLVDAEMSDVVSLLDRAQRVDAMERSRIVRDARRKVREIVLRLSLEQQNLLRRLESSEIAARVKRLIVLQDDVNSRCDEAPRWARGRQEATVLEAATTEAEIEARLGELVALLERISLTRGELAEGAADGLRILRGAGTEDAIRSARSALERFAVEEAARQGRRATRGLALLLRKVEETQGLLASDREAFYETVERVVQRQSEIIDELRSVRIDERNADRYVERERSIQDDLRRASSALGSEEPLAAVEEARLAASEAVAHLFALDQDRALGAAQLVRQLLERSVLRARDARVDSEARSAADIFAMLRRLVGLRRDLDDLSRTIPRDDEDHGVLRRWASAEGARWARQLAGRLAEVSREDLSFSLSGSVAATRTAAESLVARAGGRDEEAIGSDASAALESFAFLRAEVLSRIDELEGLARALRGGELGRAAEVLERIAGREREVVDAIARIERVAGSERLDSGEIERLRAEEILIARIVERIAEALGSAPLPALDALEAVRRDLERAEGRLAAAVLADSRQGRRDLLDAQTAAARAADRLAFAASELRVEIVRVASELETLTDSHARVVESVRAALDHEIDALGAPSRGLDDRLSRARERLASAETDAWLAAGFADRALARDLARDLGELVDRDRLAEREDSTALAETEREAALADRTEVLLDRVSPMRLDTTLDDPLAPLRGALSQAVDTARMAASAFMAGDLAMGELARDSARRALEMALGEASRLSETSPTRASSTPDLEAARRVASALADSSALARDQAAQLPGVFAAAEESERARIQLEAGDLAAVGETQSRLLERLEEAMAEVDELLALRESREKERIRHAARFARELSSEVARVDPRAFAALRRAGRTADESKTGDPGATARRELEVAAANLSAREERLRRRRELSREMRERARAGANAIDAIRRARDRLAALRATAPRDGLSASRREEESRRALGELDAAIDRFVRAEAGLGKSVVEASGQSEIASRPLRQALEDASRIDAGAALGTSMTSESSRATGERIAGPLARGLLSGERPPDRSGTPVPAVSKGGEQLTPGTGPIEPTAPTHDARSPGLASRGDEGPSSRALRTVSDAWTYREAATARGPIEGRSSRAPPGAYAERLRRYFEGAGSRP